MFKKIILYGLVLIFLTLISCSSENSGNSKSFDELSDSSKTELLMNQGMDLFQERKFDIALKFFNEALKYNSKPVVDVYLMKSSTQLELGNTFEAYKDLREALNIEPNNGEVFLQLARLFNATSIPDSAYFYASEAIRVNYQDPNIYLYKSLAEISRNNLREALANIDLFVKTSKNNIYINEVMVIKTILEVTTSKKGSLKTMLKNNKKYFMSFNNQSFNDVYNYLLCLQSKKEKESFDEKVCEKIRGLSKIKISILNQKFEFNTIN